MQKVDVENLQKARVGRSPAAGREVEEAGRMLQLPLRGRACTVLTPCTLLCPDTASQGAGSLPQLSPAG